MAAPHEFEQPETLEGLRSLTVVIPTFNRPAHLARLLNYYAAKNTRLSFLILDSSGPEAVDSNRQASTVLGNRARHVAFASSVPLATKLSHGLGLVETPYCALCADDDLVFIEGLTQALAYLGEHPDCVCTDGIYLNYFKSGANVQLKVEYASTGIDAEYPGARVFRLFQKYESLFYGVFRTPDIADIFAGVSRNPSLHYQELFQATSALLIGKSHRLPVFYAARQHCDPAEPTRDKWQTYYWFADDPGEFLAHYLAYRDELWAFYQRHGAEPRLPKEAFSKSMDLAHAVFFGTGCPPVYFHSVLQSQWPNDTFRKPDPVRDNICNQLKSARRHLWENRVEKFTVWLQDKVAAQYSARSLARLNAEIQAGSNTMWNCELVAELRWLAGVGPFRVAYRELCRYLDLP